VAEEIESLGREQFNKLKSALRVLLVDMLKWDCQPELRARSWAPTIKEQRIELDDVLEDNPGLRVRLEIHDWRARRRVSSMTEAA
jgi:hypothetical protein